MNTRIRTYVLSLCAACVLAGEAEPVPAPATEPAADPKAAPSPAALATLVLAPGDQLKIEVYDNPDLSTTLRVAVEPSTFPQIGSIGVLVGMTPRQVAEMLTKRLEDGFLKHPSVTVEVVSYTRRSAAVLGAVRTPQRVDLPPFVKFGALQALADAGGLLEDGSGTRVLLLRRPADGGAAELRVIDPASGATGDVILVDGDVLIVPRLDRIFVLGEVGRPGPITLSADKDLTVTQAISSAGGFNRAARKARVQLLRDGTRTPLDVGAILNGTAKNDMVLKPGDVVFVPDSLF